MGGIVMSKILFYNYCLSVFFSNGKRDLFKKGTWFLFAHELFFISISFGAFLITRFDYRIPNGILLFLLLFIWYITFYGTRNWVLSQLEIECIDRQYNAMKPKTGTNTLIGFLLFAGSFFLQITIVILTFQGYLMR